MSLLHRSSGITYGMHSSQLAVAQVHPCAIFLKHNASAWVRRASTCPVKRWRSVFTAGLTGMLTITCCATSRAWLLQAQHVEHCIRPKEMQYPAAADLFRQLLHLDPLARPSAVQAQQHA